MTTRTAATIRAAIRTHRARSALTRIAAIVQNAIACVECPDGNDHAASSTSRIPMAGRGRANGTLTAR